MPAASCPTCKKPVAIPPVDQPMGTFPFCSDRCRLIDLGRWQDGTYQIPAEPSDDDADETPPDVWEDPNAKRRH